MNYWAWDDYGRYVEYCQTCRRPIYLHRYGECPDDYEDGEEEAEA